MQQPQHRCENLQFGTGRGSFNDDYMHTISAGVTQCPSPHVPCAELLDGFGLNLVTATFADVSGTNFVYVSVALEA